MFLDDSGNERSLKEKNQVRDDLRDLVVLGVVLRERMADGGSMEVRRRQWDRLDQAEAAFGPSAILQYAARLPPVGRGRFGSGAVHGVGPLCCRPRFAPRRQGGSSRRRMERAVALQPQGFWPNFYEGVCAYRRGHFVEAEAALRVCVALRPNSARVITTTASSKTPWAVGTERKPTTIRRCNSIPTWRRPGSTAAAWITRKSARTKRRDLVKRRAHGADTAAVHYNLALVQRARGEKARPGPKSKPRYA